MSTRASPARATPSSSGGKTWRLLAAAAAFALGSSVAACGKTEPAGAEAPAKPPVVHEPTVVYVDPFILNLADPAGDRYFRLNMRLVLDQRPIAERAASGLAQVVLRDRILSLLSKKRAEQVMTVEGKELLRTELMLATEPLLAQAPFHDPEHDPAPARVLDVLFTEFLVQ